jgi:hypothetical protein
MAGHQRARAFVRELVEAGWVVTMRGSGHYRAIHPAASRPLFFAATPSDHRSLLNARATARRLLREGKDRMFVEMYVICDECSGTIRARRLGEKNAKHLCPRCEKEAS